MFICFKVQFTLFTSVFSLYNDIDSSLKVTAGGEMLKWSDGISTLNTGGDVVNVGMSELRD